MLTEPQRRFLSCHRDNQVLPRFNSCSRPTYDFVGRVRDLGLIEIVDGAHSGWPYTWKGTRLTDLGRETLAAKG